MFNVESSAHLAMDKAIYQRTALPGRYSGNLLPVNSLVNSSLTMPSRLPQRRDSKIPGPPTQVTPRPSSPPSSSTVASPPPPPPPPPIPACSSSSIAPPKKFLNPPSKLTSGEQSLRSVSPATVFKCKSNAQATLQTVTTASTPASNLCKHSGGIRPPRSSSCLQSTQPCPSVQNKAIPMQAKSTSIKTPITCVSRQQQQSRTLRDTTKTEDQSNHSRTVLNGSKCNRPGNGLTSNRSDSTLRRESTLRRGSTPRRDSTLSLAENESGSEKQPNTTGKTSVRSSPVKQPGLAIPLPKSRPSSMCLENSTNGHNTSNGVQVPLKQGKTSGLRPLSSSGIPKTGISTPRETPSLRVNRLASEESREPGKRLKGPSCNEASFLASTKSEPNVARVSPIRRQIGQSISASSEASTRLPRGSSVSSLSSKDHQVDGSQTKIDEATSDSNIATTINCPQPLPLPPPPSQPLPTPPPSPSSETVIHQLTTLTAPVIKSTLKPVAEESRLMPAPVVTHPPLACPPPPPIMPKSNPIPPDEANYGSGKVFRTVDLNSNIISFLNSEGDRSKVPTPFNAISSESSQQLPVNIMSPVMEDESCSDIGSISDLRSLNQLILDTKSSGTQSSSTATTTTNNNGALLSQITRRSKCTMPSEAEINLKCDLLRSGQGSGQPLTELINFASTNVTPPPGLSSSLTQAKRLSKNGDLRGSAISLLSGSSSFSATEERHHQEVKKLREELNRANTKVETLTQQLRNSNEMIATFGKSLETLRSRLHQCSLSTEQKDREINRLKTTIEILRRECQNDSASQQNGFGPSSEVETRRDKSKQRRSGKEPRSPSCDRDNSDSGPGWFKGSIQRAFKKNRGRNRSGSSTSEADIVQAVGSAPGGDSNSLPSTPVAGHKNDQHPLLLAGPEHDLVKEESELIEDLKKQLREKERQLNEIRLEALLTASQMESMNEKITKMTKEMSILRSENHRLQCLLQRQSIASSVGSLTSCFEPSSSAAASGNMPAGYERKIPIKLGDRRISLLTVNPKLTWEQLDETVKRAFDTYLRKIDSERLEMRSSCLISYSFGNERFERKFPVDRNRQPSAELPALSDIITRNNCLNLYLRNKLEYLALETSTPKSVLEKLTNHLRESRRLIICGPPHCGKSYIAVKCCQFLLEEHCVDCASGIASISVREKGEKEIECLLSNILSCDEGNRPRAIVFKGIQRLPNFASLLKTIRGINCNEFPIILCTMRGVNNSTTNLQIYHNFRSVIYNHSFEPCKNLLSRVLRQKAVDDEIEALLRGASSNFQAISLIIDWLQQLFHHLNLFLASLSSPLTPHNLGPKVFFSCPLDIESSREWFVDTWNYTVVPNVRRIIEEINPPAEYLASQDPLNWIKDNYPWIEDKESLHKLSSIIDASPESTCKPKFDSITDQLVSIE